MPRKWQMVNKVRGVALSKERFQFIFKEERDLEDILNTGAHTYNQWSLVIDRWVDKIPVGYLQFLPVWVQLRNIPVNHKTIKSIMAFGEFAGQVTEVAFDPSKPQRREYIRVNVLHDVSRLVRRSNVINLPNGEVTTILYDFERIQKRCYTCQRLTHEQEKCPLFISSNKLKPESGVPVKISLGLSKEVILKEGDPLFGVLSEDQVGINRLTGRPRIAQEVLEGMRIYLLVANGPERIIRESRVKSSIEDMKHDPVGQKTMLRLEPSPMLSPEVDNGKGIVFSFEKKNKDKGPVRNEKEEAKLMRGAIDSGIANSRKPWTEGFQSESEMVIAEVGNPFFTDSPTGYRIGFSEAGSSGKSFRKGKPRKCPHMRKRKLKVAEVGGLALTLGKKEGDLIGKGEKRKAVGEIEGVIHQAQRLKPLAVLVEGLSNPQ